jgi:hypothetical protein
VRFTAIVLALATTILVPAAALAAPSDTQPAAHGAHKFPMKAAEFQAKVDARTKKAREHMEQRLAKHNASEADKETARARFDAGVAEIQKVVSGAAADGVVTKDEAQKVREKAKEVRHAGPSARHGKK